ncbi:sigma 54-interacting transcriptional regulator [Phaeovulum sp. W22_SRMD_FR3]|uniref:sigma-54-dependent transcriptional regulator n=1 Tax=Phaeovulum sp. W22_SRMD_FR3 TaxID=3240274 RepID=UPI003F9D8692
MTLQSGNQTVSVLMIDLVPPRHVTEASLREEGYRLKHVDTADAALQAFRRNEMQIVVMALRLPDRDALALLGEMLAERPDVPVIVTSPASEIDRAVEAMRAGAHDFLVTPYDVGQLAASLKSAFGAPTPGAFLGGSHRAHAEAAQSVPGFVGNSPIMQRLYARIRAIAASDAPCFLTGESGSGKDTAAHAIHALSPRQEAPFITVNCAALSALGQGQDAEVERLNRGRALALSADGGTLFLDEICDLAPALQTYLIKLLETSTVRAEGPGGPRKVDLRVISASRHDPHNAIRAGRLREDLYYRLNVVGLLMPPLRQRRDDILLLAQRMLSDLSRIENQGPRHLAAEARTLLVNYDWPGNIRELSNCIRAAVVMCTSDEISADALPAALTRSPPPAASAWETAAPYAPGVPTEPMLQPLAQAQPMGVPSATVANGSLMPAPNGHANGSAAPKTTPQPPSAPREAWRGMTLAEIERQAIEAALSRHDGSVPRAARELAVAPSTLYRKMAQWTDPETAPR